MQSKFLKRILDNIKMYLGTSYDKDPLPHSFNCVH